MSGLTPFVAGNVLTAAQLNLMLPLSVVKLATETVTSSTTLQNDDELFLTFGTTGVTYLVTARIGYFGAAAGDIKIAWTRTGTLTMLANRGMIGPGTATVDTSAAVTTAGSGIQRTAHGFAIGTAVAYGADGTNNAYLEETFILRADAAGVLQMQWAQNASSGTGTTVNSGSSLIAIPIA